MPDGLTFDPKMSDSEALMWRMEQDPHLSSTFANVTLLDRPADAALFRARMERATWMVRRLRQRVHPAPANLSAPTWEDDPDFDIDFHVRRIALPKPGTLRQLLDLASLIAADPFDRTRPLWQFYVVDGVRGGKGALIQKMHHTIADGEASLAMSLQFLDFERDAPAPPALDPALMADAVAEEDHRLNLARDLTAATWRLPLGIAKQMKNLVANPSAIPSAGGGIGEIVANLKNPPQTASQLWAGRSLKRRMEILEVPLETTKAAAKRMGGTLNTAFLTAAAAAAGEYHLRLGEPVETMHATMAVSTRTKQSGSNAFSLARFAVPTAEMSAADRFAIVLERTSQARSATTGLEALAAIVAAIPTPVLARFARRQAYSVDFATSNVRAAPMKVYVAGAEILGNYPIGPLLGVAFNATLMSYNGKLDIGLNCDTAAVTDTELLRDCLRDAFRDLTKSG